MKIDPFTYQILEKVRDQLFEEHQDDPNFTGCGIGFSFREGTRTDESAVIAMVVNKLPAGAVSKKRLLPRNVRVGERQYRVDVVESRATLPRSNVTQPVLDATTSEVPITGFFVPPLQGCSISLSNPNADQGTLGCFVYDNDNDNICVLSTSHVIANFGSAAIGSSILQPSLSDTAGISANPNTIASLTRFVTYTGDSSNTVDAGIATLNDQNNFSANVAEGLMAPISDSHPAVGLLVATDDSSSNCFLCRMDNVLSRLNVSLFGTTGSSAPVVAPEVGTNIEKVGCTTAYTSSTIDAIGVIVQVTYPSGEIQVFYDQIWTQAFGLPGETGAVACIGGNGETYAPAPADDGCPFLAEIEGYYAFPDNASSELNTFTNQAQDSFLTHSKTGNLLISLVYLNTQVMIDRMQDDQGSAYNQATAQTFMQQFYTKYYDTMTSYVAGPALNTFVTSAEVIDVGTIMDEVGGPASQGYEGLLSTGQNLDINSQSYISSRSGVPEATAVAMLYLIFASYITQSSDGGKSLEQIAAYMNEETIYDGVYKYLSNVRTIKMPEQAELD